MVQEQGRIIHNSLRKHRKMMGYTLREVAWLLNLKSAGRLSKWEKGSSYPSLKNLLMLCIAYQTLVDQFYHDYRNELAIGFRARLKSFQAKNKLKSHAE
jgi:transcriptional regulator with XRE-family HTH domain